MKKRIGILTGGGDVPPLNAVIHSAIEQSKERNIELLGFLNGWQGVLDGNYAELAGISLNPLIGGTVLRSSRVNLLKVEDAKKKVEDILSKNNIDGFIVIGGEDTLSNAFVLKSVPQVLISKTIDNDVGIFDETRIVNYFTLGYPTAAEKISSFVSLNEGLRTTAYSHERIIVVESMGMHAGWLALSSSFGHPDFIIIPEFPLDYNLLLHKVSEKYKMQKNVIIVIAEGSKWEDGNYISAGEDDKDSFGHPKFKGAAKVLAQKLKEDLRNDFDTRNVNHVNPSYLYRAGKPNVFDTAAAKMLGREAINLFGKDLDEPVFLVIKDINKGFRTKEFLLKNLNNIEDFHRFVNNILYDSSNFKITDKGRKYLSKILREFPKNDYGIVEAGKKI